MSKTTNSTTHTDADSPFHAGEQEFQNRIGKRDSIERFGKKVIRPYMPDQHRDFYSQLPFIVIGSVDDNGWPWASILPGKPGFITSPTPKQLNLDSSPISGDPLTNNIKRESAPLGFVGIELGTRRRNRVNGRITTGSGNGFSIKVDQSFGNCPQYIQKRSVEFIRDPSLSNINNKIVKLKYLSNYAKDIITKADTFFVASYVNSINSPTIEGVDVSHRGGRPGFIKIEDDTLTIPDYPGNNHFNTLGNFLINPKAGLIFADFATGDLVMLTGKVTLPTEGNSLYSNFKGAERFWQFELDHGLVLKDALPFRSTLSEYSPNTNLTGNWAEAEQLLNQQKEFNSYLPYQVTEIQEESSVIRSITLKPINSKILPSFKAGQFLTVSIKPTTVNKPLVRNYTLSSAPNDNFYRISVKREEQGFVSNYLHDNVTIGDTILAKAPRGNFYIDATVKRPAVLLSAGVGITPIISMAKHIVNEGIRTRYFRPTTIIHSAKDSSQRAFYQEFKKLQALSNNSMQYISLLSNTNSNDKAGIDFNAKGRINAEIIQQVLPLADYDFYVCGPSSYVQDVFDILLTLGVRDKRIFTEAFGPSTLIRKSDVNKTGESHNEASQAIVEFGRSKFEQNWETSDGTLLETAEKHGLSPEYSCRNGSCGSCMTKLISGDITYRTPPTYETDDDQILICCAVPSNNSKKVAIDL